MKYANKDEYNGKWYKNSKFGFGVFKRALTGEEVSVMCQNDNAISIDYFDIRF